MYENYRREDIENHIHKIGFHPLVPENRPR